MTELFKYDFTVLESNLDVFGHVNNATYLELYEQARWDFITPRGFGLDNIKKNKIGPVLLEAHLYFRKELLLRENITIETQVTNQKNSKLIDLSQKMLRNGNIEVSRLDCVVGLFDIEKRKLLTNTPDWLKAIGVN